MGMFKAFLIVACWLIQTINIIKHADVSYVSDSCKL